MNTSSRIVPFVLVIGLLTGLSWRLQSAPVEAPGVSSIPQVLPELTPTEEGAYDATEPLPALPAILPAPPSEANGQEHRVVDVLEEDERASQQYRARIEANIDHLELASEAAQARGQYALADVMDKRIDGLLRRRGEAHLMSP